LGKFKRSLAWAMLPTTDPEFAVGCQKAIQEIEENR
jgi:hypothetical protein